MKALSPSNKIGRSSGMSLHHLVAVVGQNNNHNQTSGPRPPQIIIEPSLGRFSKRQRRATIRLTILGTFSHCSCVQFFSSRHHIRRSTTLHGAIHGFGITGLP